MFALLAAYGGQIVPSRYTLDVKTLGFDIVTWTFERSDLRRGASAPGFLPIRSSGQAAKMDSTRLIRRHRADGQKLRLFIGHE